MMSLSPHNEDNHKLNAGSLKRSICETSTTKATKLHEGYVVDSNSSSYFVSFVVLLSFLSYPEAEPEKWK
jgi:hypothetical protein